jgi:membrane protein DedA with SNARE-associated domain
MWITEFLATYMTAFIAKTWYISIFIGMTLESMIFPMPSEAIMPFAWFLIATKTFSLWMVILVSTLWSIFGSLISYYIWKYWWVPFVKKFGKYFFLDHHELEITHKFFQKRWEITIFVSRFIPIIRHLISIPAGIGNMNLVKFIIYTTIGAWLRNTFLALVGKYLKQNRELVMKYSKIIDIAILVILVWIIVLFIWRQIKKRNKLRVKSDK